MSSQIVSVNQLHHLRAQPAAMQEVRIDRENKVIIGYNVAELGLLKSPGRGEFDDKTLNTARRLMRTNPEGTMVKYDHANGDSTGMGTVLGRAKNPRVVGNSLKADLYFDESAFKTPQGDLASYVMDIAESDPGLISSSLSLYTDFEFRLTKSGALALDAETGIPLPPLWRPTRILSSDIVTIGDAVHSGFLAAGGSDTVPTIRLEGEQTDEPEHAGRDPQALAAAFEFRLKQDRDIDPRVAAR